MMKTLSVILIVLMMALVLPGVSAELTPVSITEPVIVDVNATEPSSAAENETIVEVNKTPVIVTPTPVPTLESMARAYELANGNTFPNYRVVPIPTYMGDGKGALNIQDMCYHNLISKGFTIQKVTNPKNIAFASGNRVQKEFTELFEKSGFELPYELNPRGNWNDRILPGIYVVNLFDGNGGQPEWAVVEIFESYQSDVYFIGHGVTFKSAEDVCVPSYTITSALYGLVHCNNVVVHNGDYEFVQHHEATPEINGARAWDETVIDVAAWNEQIPAVTHVVRHPAEYQPSGGQHDVHAKKLTGNTNSAYDFIYNGDKFRITNDNNDTKFKKVSDAHDEIVIDVPARTVHHPAVTHVVHHPAVSHVDAKPAWDEYKYVGEGNGDFKKVCQDNDRRGHDDHDEHNENECTYVSVATTTECQSDGENIDITGNVQSVVNGGTTTFLFNNARVPGGIFDETTTQLLSPINDPAYGLVKDVVISYTNGCGITNTIQTKEYCTIDIISGSATCPSG
jgi:hypothetical protein